MHASALLRASRRPRLSALYIDCLKRSTLTRDSYCLKGVAVVIVEFSSNLANGQAVHVVAQVGLSVELESVVRAQDDQTIPLEDLNPSDRFSLEVESAMEYRRQSYGDGVA